MGPMAYLVNTYVQVRTLDIHVLEPESSIEVRAAKATRYSIFIGYMLDKSQLP